LINFDEQHFLATVSQTAIALLQIDHNEVMMRAKKCIYHYVLCSRNVMNYFQNVLLFYQKVISQHFSHRYGNQKNKQGNSGGQGNIDENAKDLSKIEGKALGGGGAGGEIRRGSGMEQQTSGHVVNQEETTPQQ
jgi:hypothetical protein